MNQDMSHQLQDDLVLHGEPTILKKFKNFFAIGTACGMVVLYEVSSNFSTSILLTPAKYKNKYGPVSALDITFDNKVMAIGYTNGYIDLIEIDNQYKFDTYKDIHKDVVLKLKFIHEFYDSLQVCELISSDCLGGVMRTKIKISHRFGRLFTTPQTIPLFESQVDEENNSSQAKFGNDVQGTKNDACIDISYFSSDFAIKHLKIKVKLLTLVFQNSGLIVVQLNYDTAKLLLQVDDIEFVDTQSPPIVSWGEAGFNTSAISHAVLLIGWGSYIFLMKLQIIEGEINFIKASSAYLGEPIQYCGFISNSMIVAIFGKKIGILHTIEFELGFSEQDEPVKYIENFELQSPLDFEQQEIFVKGYKSNYRFFSCSYKENELYFIYKNKVIFSKLTQWEEFFKQKQDQGNWQEVMQLAMLVDSGKIQYLGGIDCNPTTRKEIMKVYFQELALSFMAVKLSDGKNRETIKNLSILAEFLLQSGNSDFLFTTVLNNLQANNLYEDFLSLIQNFIRSQKVKEIPSHTLDSILNFFIENHRFDMVQKILLALDLSKIDTQPLLHLCVEHGLYRPLIYISTKYLKDFLTPLVKIHENLSKINPQQAQKLGYRVLWYIRQCFTQKFLHGDRMRYNDAIKMVSDILKFISFKEKIMGLVKIDPQLSLDVIFKLFEGDIAEIINENSEFLLSLFDLKSPLPEISQQIQQQQQEDPEQTQNFVNLIEIFQGLNLSIIHQHLLNLLIDIFEQIKVQHKENPNKYENEYKYFLTFFARILNLRIYILNDEIKFNIVIYFLENPGHFNEFINTYINDGHFTQFSHMKSIDIFEYDLMKLIKNGIPINYLSENIKSHYRQKYNTFSNVAMTQILHEISSQENNQQQQNQQQFRKKKNKINMQSQVVSIQQLFNQNGEEEENHAKYLQKNIFLVYVIQEVVQSYLIAIDKKNPNLFDIFEEDNLKEMIQMSRVNDFEIFAVYLMHQFQFYEECLEYFLKTNFISKNQEEFFTWLNLILENIQNQLKKDRQIAFKNLLVQNFRQLLEINPVKSHEIIQDHLRNFEFLLIDQLAPHKDQQIEFIEKVISNPNSESLRDIQEIKIIFIQLLAETDPNQVAKKLKNLTTYPMDKILEICQQYKIRKAEAMILQKLGEVEDALQIYCNIFIKKLREQLATLYKAKDKEIGNNKEKLIKTLNKCVSVCIQSQHDDDQEDTLWFKLWDKILKEINLKNLTCRKIPEVIQDLCCSLISDLFETMCVNLDTGYIIEKFTNKYGSVPLRVFINTNNTIKKNFDFAHTTHESTTKDLQITIHKLQNLLKVKHGRGFTNQSEDMTCYLCAQSIEFPEEQSQDPLKIKYLGEDYQLDLTEQIQVFYCNHVYHKKCLIQNNCDDFCYICRNQQDITPETLQNIIYKKSKLHSRKQQEREEGLSRTRASSSSSIRYKSKHSKQKQKQKSKLQIQQDIMETYECARHKAKISLLKVLTGDAKLCMQSHMF